MKGNLPISIPASIWLFMILALVNGCHSIKRLPSQVIYPQKAIEKATANGLSTEYFESVDWVNDNWWELFKDPLLTAYIEKALADNPSIRIADAKVWIANAAAKVKIAGLYPTLGLNADSFRLNFSEQGFFGTPPPAAQVFPFHFTDHLFGFNFSYEFDWWGKHRHTIAAAAGEFQAAVAESAIARLAIAMALAEAYLQYQTYYQLEEIALQQKELEEQRLALSKERLHHQMDNQLSLEVRQRAVRRASDTLLASRQVGMIAKHRTQALLTGSFEEEIPPRALHCRDPFPLPKSLPFDLLAHRPDICAQLWRVYAEAHRVDVAKTLFFPNINLLALVGWDSLHLSTLFKNASCAGIWGGAIHLPIFQGGALWANLEGQQYLYAANVSEYEALIFKAVREVLDAISGLQILKARLLELNANERSAANSYQLVEERFNHQLSSKYDLLSAQSEWLLTKAEKIKIEGQIDMTLLALIKALGGGFGPC